MTPALSITLTERLKLPVETVVVDGLPKILAGNLPVTPINIALKWKQEYRAATKPSLDSYAHASRLYVEFAAHRGRSLVNVTNEEFRSFTQALQGRYFLDEKGRQQLLCGARGPRTADTIIALLYSLAEKSVSVQQQEQLLERNSRRRVSECAHSFSLRQAARPSARRYSTQS